MSRQTCGWCVQLGDSTTPFPSWLTGSNGAAASLAMHSTESQAAGSGPSRRGRRRDWRRFDVVAVNDASPSGLVTLSRLAAGSTSASVTRSAWLDPPQPIPAAEYARILALQGAKIRMLGETYWR